MRRGLNDLVRNPEGKVSESKVWANVGKCIAVYLLLRYPVDILGRYDTLLILFGVLVFPDIIKKMISMKYDHSAPKTTP